MRRLRVWAFLAATAAPTPLIAQETLRVDVDLVTVVATVTDTEGRYVPGLGPASFRVEDNGVPQTIIDFKADREVPVSLGIILDTSASMASRMRTALAAIDRFLGTLDPDDDVFLATFAGRTAVLEDFTSDRRRLSRALERVRESGQTALYDGLAMGLEKVHDGRHSKRAILLVTDGSDVGSDATLEAVVARLNALDVLVYALGIEPVQSDPAEHVRFDWPVTAFPGARGLARMPALDQAVDMAVLRRFAAASGGRAYTVSGTWTDGTIDDVDRILDEVAAELRSQYTFTYTPASTGGSRYHTIHVDVPGTGHTVRTRDGYTSR